MKIGRQNFLNTKKPKK